MTNNEFKYKSKVVNKLLFEHLRRNTYIYLVHMGDHSSALQRSYYFSVQNDIFKSYLNLRIIRIVFHNFNKESVALRFPDH